MSRSAGVGIGGGGERISAETELEYIPPESILPTPLPLPMTLLLDRTGLGSAGLSHQVDFLAAAAANAGGFAPTGPN